MAVTARAGFDHIVSNRDWQGRTYYEVRSADNWRSMSRHYDEAEALAELASRTASRKREAAHEKATKLLKGARATLDWSDYVARHRDLVEQLVSA